MTALRAAVARIADMIRRERTRRQLLALSDMQLEDLGLSRADVDMRLMPQGRMTAPKAAMLRAFERRTPHGLAA